MPYYLKKWEFNCTELGLSICVSCMRLCIHAPLGHAPYCHIVFEPCRMGFEEVRTPCMCVCACVFLYGRRMSQFRGQGFYKCVSPMKRDAGLATHSTTHKCTFHIHNLCQNDLGARNVVWTNAAIYELWAHSPRSATCLALTTIKMWILGWTSVVVKLKTQPRCVCDCVCVIACVTMCKYSVTVNGVLFELHQVDLRLPPQMDVRIANSLQAHRVECCKREIEYAWLEISTAWQQYAICVSINPRRLC